MSTLANLEQQINSEVITFWHDVDEMNRFARMVSFKVLSQMMIDQWRKADLLDDMMQTVWEVALICKRTNPLMPKGQIVAQCKHTLFRFVTYTLNLGDVGAWQDGRKQNVYRVMRFHRFCPDAERSYSDEEVLRTIHGDLSDNQLGGSMTIDPEEALVRPISTQIDQWMPELEDVLFRIIAAMRLHNAPAQKLRLATNRRHAFVLTCRLRGMLNHQIATVTKRSSDPTKGRMRIGADVAAARRAIAVWLELTPNKRDAAIERLNIRYPNYAKEPIAYPSLDREWLWSEIAYTIHTGNGQAYNNKVTISR